MIRLIALVIGLAMSLQVQARDPIGVFERQRSTVALFEGGTGACRSEWQDARYINQWGAAQQCWRAEGGIITLCPIYNNRIHSDCMYISAEYFAEPRRRTFRSRN